MFKNSLKPKNRSYRNGSDWVVTLQAEQLQAKQLQAK